MIFPFEEDPASTKSPTWFYFLISVDFSLKFLDIVKSGSFSFSLEIESRNDFHWIFTVNRLLEAVLFLLFINQFKNLSNSWIVAISLVCWSNFDHQRPLAIETLAIGLFR